MSSTILTPRQLEAAIGQHCAGEMVLRNFVKTNFGEGVKQSINNTAIQRGYGPLVDSYALTGVAVTGVYEDILDLTVRFQGRSRSGLMISGDVPIRLDSAMRAGLEAALGVGPSINPTIYDSRDPRLANVEPLPQPLHISIQNALNAAGRAPYAGGISAVTTADQRRYAGPNPTSVKSFNGHPSGTDPSRYTPVDGGVYVSSDLPGLMGTEHRLFVLVPNGPNHLRLLSETFLGLTL